MLYIDFKDKKPSALGMGCMRLPERDGEIDVAATKELVAYAIKNGINPPTIPNCTIASNRSNMKPRLSIKPNKEKNAP